MHQQDSPQEGKGFANQNLSSKAPREAWVFYVLSLYVVCVPFYGLVNLNTEEGVDSSQNNGSGDMARTHLECILVSQMEVGSCLCPRRGQKFVISLCNRGSVCQHAYVLQSLLPDQTSFAAVHGREDQVGLSPEIKDDKK